MLAACCQVSGSAVVRASTPFTFPLFPPVVARCGVAPEAVKQRVQSDGGKALTGAADQHEETVPIDRRENAQIRRIDVPDGKIDVGGPGKRLRLQEARRRRRL